MSNTQRRFALSPAVQAVFDRLSNHSYHIRHYPGLAEAFGNPLTSIVFCRLLYHDDLRVKRNAEFFARTDHQLAAECGLGLDQFARARDLITAGGIELFEKVRRGMPPINHYRANYGRIHAWLTAHGFGQIELPQSPPAGLNLPKSSKLNAGKPPNRFAENQPPLKELVEKFIDDDDAARARKIDAILMQNGIDNPTRLQLVTVWCQVIDGVEAVNRVVSRTFEEFLLLERSPGGRKIKSYAGLVVARLRGDYEERTGRSATDISPTDLSTVRAVLAMETIDEQRTSFL